MALDPHRYPLLRAELLKVIQQPDVLLQISFRGSASLEYPTETTSASCGTFFGDELEQLVEASIEAGVTVIDGRPCDVDAYYSVTYPDGGIETISDEDLRDRYDRLPDTAGRSMFRRIVDWFRVDEGFSVFPPPKRK